MWATRVGDEFTKLVQAVPAHPTTHLLLVDERMVVLAVVAEHGVQAVRTCGAALVVHLRQRQLRIVHAQGRQQGGDQLFAQNSNLPRHFQCINTRCQMTM